MSSPASSVIVTGASSGIGKSVTNALLRSGVFVIGIDINWNDKEALSPDICLSMDVSDPEQVDAEFKSLPKDLPPVKGAVLAAGSHSRTPSIDLEFAQWRKTVGVHLDGAFLISQASARLMGSGGSIVLFSSVAEFFAWPGRAAYSASKAAVSALARTLAVEWSPMNIRVNSIALGYVDTPLIANAIAKGQLSPDVARDHASGRMAQPEEIVEPILFLLSDASSFITGSTMRIDGGYSILKNR